MPSDLRDPSNISDNKIHLDPVQIKYMNWVKQNAKENAEKYSKEGAKSAFVLNNILYFNYSEGWFSHYLNKQNSWLKDKKLDLPNRALYKWDIKRLLGLNN
jgi:hypothetical protein